MFMNLAPGLVGISVGNLDELIEVAVAAGFEGVDFPAKEIHTLEDALKAGEKVLSAGLRWGMGPAPADFYTDEGSFLKGMGELEGRLKLMAAAGCVRMYNHVWPGSNEREFGENWKWHVEKIRAVAGMCAEHGVSYGLEFIGQETKRAEYRNAFVYSLKGMKELTEEVGLGVGIVLDMFHHYCSGGTVEDVRGLDVGRIVNVHANDARAGRRREEQINLERELPGRTGIVKGKEIVKVLMEKGYGGPMIAEPFSPERERLARMSGAEAAREVVESLRGLF